MMILPWYSNDYIPSIFPLVLYTHHFPIIFPFYSNIIPIIFPLYYHHFPILFPFDSHSIPRTSPFFLFLPLTWRPRLFLSALNLSASSLGSRLPCLAAADCAKEGPLGRATRCVAEDNCWNSLETWPIKGYTWGILEQTWGRSVKFRDFIVGICLINFGEIREDGRHFRNHMWNLGRMGES